MLLCGAVPEYSVSVPGWGFPSVFTNIWWERWISFMFLRDTVDIWHWCWCFIRCCICLSVRITRKFRFSFQSGMTVTVFLSFLLVKGFHWSITYGMLFVTDGRVLADRLSGNVCGTKLFQGKQRKVPERFWHISENTGRWL